MGSQFNYNTEKRERKEVSSIHDLLLLSLVNDHPAHGYELRQLLDSGYLAHCTRISTPQIYSVLRRLAEQGLISAKVERDNNAPPRTVYEIKKKGREKLDRMLENKDIVGECIVFQFDAVLSAMGHIGGLSTEQCLPVLKTRIGVVQSQIEDCRKASKTIESPDQAPGLARAILDHRRKHLTSEIQWLKSLEKEIQEKGWASFIGSGKGKGDILSKPRV